MCVCVFQFHLHFLNYFCLLLHASLSSFTVSAGLTLHKQSNNRSSKWVDSCGNEVNWQSSLSFFLSLFPFPLPLPSLLPLLLPSSSSSTSPSNTQSSYKMGSRCHFTPIFIQFLSQGKLPGKLLSQSQFESEFGIGSTFLIFPGPKYELLSTLYLIKQMLPFSRTGLFEEQALNAGSPPITGISLPLFCPNSIFTYYQGVMKLLMIIR